MNWNIWRRRVVKLVTHPHPVRLLASRVLWHSGLSPWLTMTVSEGVRLRFYPSSISSAMWVAADTRSEDVEFLQAVVRRGDTYLDCGANVGHLAAIARQLVGPTGVVVAIEANPRISRYCVGNLELNGFHDVKVWNVALGEAHGSIRISDRRDDDQNRVGDAGAEVAMSPLDALIDLPHITVLKLDVEGYEVGVLKGALATLARTDLVYCELSSSNLERFGGAPRDVEDLLLGQGFLLAHRVGDEWRLGAQRVFDRLSEGELPSTGYNLIACKPTFVPEFEHRIRERGHRLVRVATPA